MGIGLDAARRVAACFRRARRRDTSFAGVGADGLEALGRRRGNRPARMRRAGNCEVFYHCDTSLLVLVPRTRGEDAHNTQKQFRDVAPRPRTGV